MSRLKDMTGMKFGRYTVISRAENDSRGQAFWNCLCECGTTKRVYGYYLRSGQIVSCGCHNVDSLIKRITKHGGRYDRRYNTARNILRRCNNKKDKFYHRYGGRGIECRLGDSASEVYKNLLLIDGYEESLTIDRIDNNGHYELGNLRWVTNKENAQNRGY